MAFVLGIATAALASPSAALVEPVVCRSAPQLAPKRASRSLVGRSFHCEAVPARSFSGHVRVVPELPVIRADVQGNGGVEESVAVPELPGESGEHEKKRESIKLRLLRAVAGSDRGRLLTSSENANVAALLSELSAVNPSPEPVLDARFPGSWRLIYTTKQLADISPFLRLGKTPLMSIGQVVQTIHKYDGKVENAVEVTLFPATKGRIVTQASCDLLPPSTVEIRIEKSVLSPVNFFTVDTSKLPPITVPIKELSERIRGYVPVGTNEVTYLDDDLRVTRGDKGDVFVFSKIEDGSEAFPGTPVQP
eukprot:tig00000178_g12751.t1